MTEPAMTKAAMTKAAMTKAVTPACSHCLATIVTPKAIESMLEASGVGSYRDNQPWLVAKEIWLAAKEQGFDLPILFAVRDETDVYFSHWSVVRNIELLELTGARTESRCDFDLLRAFNPIWCDIDSVFHKPSDQQLRREALEYARTLRWPLNENQLFPYALCETPPFIVSELGS